MPDLTRMRWWGPLAAILVLAAWVPSCGSAFSAAGPADGGMAETSAGDGEAVGDDTGAAADGCGAPSTCPELGWVCGSGEDACGHAVVCGACKRVNDVCVAHACRCVQIECKDVGADCGTIPDGCGGTRSCGTCGAGMNCGGGGYLKCGSAACVPRTCAGDGGDSAQCGQIADGCGGVVDCPDTCVAPQVCGVGTDANHCGCKPQTCATLGWVCGKGDDGCGGTLECGTCDGGTCDPNAHTCSCVPSKTCSSLGYTCGTYTDSCKSHETCGSDPTLVDLSTCTDPAHPHLYECPCSGVVGTSSSGVMQLAIPIQDGGLVKCQAGPTPPVPGWDCVATGPAPTHEWCCAQ